MVTATSAAGIGMNGSPGSRTLLRSRRTAASAGWLKRNLCVPPKVITIPVERKTGLQSHFEPAFSVSVDATSGQCATALGRVHIGWWAFLVENVWRSSHRACIQKLYINPHPGRYQPPVHIQVHAESKSCSLLM